MSRTRTWIGSALVATTIGILRPASGDETETADPKTDPRPLDLVLGPAPPTDDSPPEEAAKKRGRIPFYQGTAEIAPGEGIGDGPSLGKVDGFGRSAGSAWDPPRVEAKGATTDAELDAGAGLPAGDDDIFFVREEAPPPVPIDGTFPGEVAFGAAAETEAIDFSAADPVPANQPATSGSGWPLDSETFTTDNSYNPSPLRLRSLVEGRVTVRFGGSYIYDSNPNQLSRQRTVTRRIIVPPSAPGEPALVLEDTSVEEREIEGRNLFLGDLNLGYRGGAQSGPGLFYSIAYGATFYAYENSSSSGDSLDQTLRGRAGLRGGFTEISMFGSLSQNSGNNFDVGQQRREAPRAKSVGYDAGLGLRRTLSTGSIEFGAASQREEYDADETRISPADRERWSVDGAWFYRPPFLAHSSFGLGLTYAREKVDFSHRQQSVSPSLRLRWSRSEKTQFGAWVGSNTRWIDDGDGSDHNTTSPIFGTNISWQARPNTGLAIGLTRRIQQSITRPNQDLETTTANVGLQQRLRNGRSATLNYRFEYADYGGATLGAGPRGRGNDTFHQLRTSISQRFQFENLPTCVLSVFYNYNLNQNDVPAFDYSQHLVGIRLGVEF